MAGEFDKLKIRRDTEANWTSVDPVLLAGEPAWSTDTQELRIGNGSDVWSALTPIGGGVTDHGALSGLADDDHPQYLTQDEADLIYETLGTATAEVGTHTSDPHAHGDFLTEVEADGLYDALGAAATAETNAISTAGSYTDDERADHELDFDHSLLGGGVAAEDVSVDSTTLVGVGVDVQAVLEEIDDAVAALAAASHAAATEGTGIDIAGQVISVDLTELSAGGELGGTLDAPTVDATHSGSTHAAAQAAAEATAAAALAGHAGVENAHGMEHNDLNSVGANDHHAQSHGNGDHTTAFTDDTTVNAHIADGGDAHDASAISFTPHGSIAATDVQAAIQEVRDEAGGGSVTYAGAFKFS